VPPVLEILRRNPATDAAPSVAVIGGGATGEPPILVCTIVYNVRPSYLRRAIESVLNQTFAQFRYLIVDNGSTDGSAGIIKEYARADSRIETLAWRTNIVGSQWAESHAKRHWKDFNDRLTAEYYCSLDSDDYYDADFLQTSYALAERFGADIVSAGALQYKEDNPRKTHYFGSPLGTRVFAGDSKMGAMLGNIHAWRPVWGKLMKTRVYTCMHGDDMKEAMSQVGNVYDVYNMFRRFRASRTVVMAEQVLCYHTYRRASVSNNLNENSNPIKRLYFLNDWLIGALRADGAETTENLDAVNGFAFKHMDYPDLDILDRAKRSNPELVRKTVRSILETPAPDNLRRDARMATVLRRLNEILATAEGCLRNPPN
jgi:glycosyltransferase involved in cell wall biosynthesis